MHIGRFIVAAVFCALAPAGAMRGQEPPAGVLPPPSDQLQLAPAHGNPYASEEVQSLMSSDGVQAELLPAPSFDAEIRPTPYWYEPVYWFGYDPWTAGIEAGLNGSEGNNSVFSIRTGGYLRRETERWKYDSTLGYNKNHANGVETQNNGKVDARLDRILADTPWTLFVLENLIYDEFQSYDIQLSLNAGVGYQWIKTPQTDLLTRVGAGATREFGGVDNDWAPQALFGLDFVQQLSKMQRLRTKVDYFPEWADFRRYRVVSDVGWEIDLDRPKNMTLKFSLIDRYDSTPDGFEPNNLDYAALLIWKL